MGKLLSIFVILISASFATAADYISNNFLVTEKSLDFSKTTRSDKCSGSIVYPELSNDDEELGMKINEEIKDFVEVYAICNSGSRSNFSVSFDVPESGTKDFFTVRWLTEKDGKLWRIDTISFNSETGEVLVPDDIFNLLSDNMMSHMIELSAGHLSEQTTWEDFLHKIKSRDIQLYIKNRGWYIVFNADSKMEDVVDVKIPDYFLIGSGDDDRG
jgi:hypothetical protein